MRIILVFTLTLFGITPTVDAAVDLTGTWDLVGTIAYINVRLRWRIVQDGSDLTITYDSLSIPGLSGTVDAETGTFEVTGPSTCGNELTTYSGVPTDSDVLSLGGVTYINYTPTICESASASFTATRLPCGNGVLDQGEECDDGNLFGNDCCSFDCHAEANFKACDDGDPNTVGTSCLNAVCTLPGLCGNGRIDPGEECDDGSAVGGDCCSGTCVVDVDGTLCDDGNPSTHFNVCVAGTCITPSDVFETQINTETRGDQINPDVSCAVDGSFVVAWNDSNSVVRARHIDSAGTPSATEAVDVRAPAYNLAPSVATDRDGTFVMAWGAPTESATRILTRRFNSAGTALGPPQQVTSSSMAAFFPDIALDSSGSSVVVWQQRDASQDSRFTVDGRRFDSTGSPVGSEIPINYWFQPVSNPRVATDAAGNFVVAWQEYSFRVKARRYLSSGFPEGPILSVTEPREENGQFPHVSSSAAGDFIVAWSDEDRFVARRYSSIGEPIGSDVELAGAYGDVAMDADGNFILVATADDGFGRGIVAQRYDSNGSQIGEPFQVNGFTYSDQYAPSVCVAPGGGFVIAWQSAQQDGSGSGIFARRFGITPLCPGDCDGNHAVSVDEIVTGVNIILGHQTVAACPSLDRDMSETATVDELVGAVNNFLAGC